MSEGVEATNEDLVGTVLEVLPVLLAEGRTDEVLEAVPALVARNETLERQLAAMVRTTTKNNEGVSKDQLRLFLDRLQEQTQTEEPRQEQAEVDARLLAVLRLQARHEPTPCFIDRNHLHHRTIQPISFAAQDEIRAPGRRNRTDPPSSEIELRRGGRWVHVGPHRGPSGAVCTVDRQPTVWHG